MKRRALLGFEIPLVVHSRRGRVGVCGSAITADDKCEIFLALGSNLTLKDKILRIQLAKPFELIGDGLEKSNSLFPRLEPQRELVAAGRNGGSRIVNPAWVDRAYPSLFHLPSLPGRALFVFCFSFNTFPLV